MDFSESLKVVFSRIKKLEPENATRVFGYILLQDINEGEMIRLSFGPDNLIQALINKAKLDISLSSKPIGSLPIQSTSLDLTSNSDIPLRFSPYLPASSRPLSSPATPYCDQQPIPNLDFIPPFYESINNLHNQSQFLNLDGQVESGNAVGLGNFCYSDAALGGLAGRTSRRSPSLPEFPLKVCHYYNKGYCKNGTSCRYLHEQTFSDSLFQFFGPNGSELANEDHMFLPGSLEKLELELAELLKSRRGYPVSIAALPMLYYEKYGRILQAEGYLTESQRHGKAGYSLTKLLARLKNSIRVIDRPHGQHAVILAEDAPRYVDYRSERNDSVSRQIYLTFPAESTFTEEDVANYFMSFGPVQDVRIPCQQKRMFGFVTFLYPETVKKILSKGNPHFVSGSRVLVKPYREKSRLPDRKIESPMDYPSSYLEIENELQPMPRGLRGLGNSMLLRKQLMNEHALELERRRLADFQLAANPLNHSPYFGYSMDELKFLEEQNDFQSAGRFNYLLDVMNNGSTSDDIPHHSHTNYNDPESNQGLNNLPESPPSSSPQIPTSSVNSHIEKF